MGVLQELRLRGGLALVTCAALSLMLAQSVAADTTEASVQVGVAECQDTAVQLCEPVATQEFLTGDGPLIVTFTAAAQHCSSVIAHILVDGSERYVSDPLGPGQSTGARDLGRVGAGPHTVAVQAEGVVGGCNNGGLANWAGTLTVSREVPSTAAATDYSLILLLVVLAAALLAVLFFFWWRRRRGSPARDT